MSQAGESTEMTRRLGRELAAGRVSLGLTQRQVGQQIGLQQSGVYRLEAGLWARFSTIAAYADLLGYDVEISLVPAVRSEP